jgi:hypothetical protein
MASARMPDEFFDTLAHHLPPEQPVGPKGGRPRVGHHTVVRVIWLYPSYKPHPGRDWGKDEPVSGQTCASGRPHPRTRSLRPDD